MEEVDTPRLRLHAPTLDALAAERSSLKSLGGVLVARAPASWPPALLEGVAPIFFDMIQRDATVAPWLGWYWVKKSCEREGATLVALGGFKGAPDARGEVEIGYSVLAAYRGRGFATEGVIGLTRWALSREDVTRVIARVSVSNTASQRVLLKAGYEVCERGPEELLFECMTCGIDG